MAEKDRAGKGTGGSTDRSQGDSSAKLAEERAVIEALDKARQNVKGLVKKEMMGEALTSSLLNFRLKGPL